MKGLVVASALLVTGLGYMVSAHEDRQTMVAAEKAKEWGIDTYRVTQRGGGLRPSPTDPQQPSTTHLFAELLNAHGQTVGKWRATIRWRRERDETLKVNKHFETTKEYSLTWMNETLDVKMGNDQWTVGYNGHRIHTGPFGARAPELESFIKDHEMLFRISGAIEADLNKANQPGPAEVQCCASGGVVCAGTPSWGTGYALQRSEACERAAIDANSGCWNQFCIGCCSFSDCSAWCGGAIIGAEFICTARVKGTNCRCSLFQVN
jgi:hypothetical protein